MTVEVPPSLLVGMPQQEREECCRHCFQANPAHNRLHQRAPHKLLSADYEDFRPYVTNPYPVDGRLDSLNPLGYTYDRYGCKYLIAFDPWRRKRYAFSRIPCVVFEPIRRRQSKLSEQLVAYIMFGGLGLYICAVLAWLFVWLLSDSADSMQQDSEPEMEFTTDSVESIQQYSEPEIELSSESFVDPSSSKDGKLLSSISGSMIELLSILSAILYVLGLPAIKFTVIILFLVNILPLLLANMKQRLVKMSTTNPNPSRESRKTNNKGNNNSIRQRRKGSRRANRENQVIASAADVHAIVPSPLVQTCTSQIESVDQELMEPTGKTLLVLGDQLQNVNVSMNANEKTDDCPTCLGTFQKELASTFCAILPCRHSFCLPCLVGLDEFIDTGRADPNDHMARSRGRECPCCRNPTERLLESAVNEIMGIPTIKNRLDLLQGISLQDKRGIVKNLSRTNKFVISTVEMALEDMLIGSLAMPVSAASQQAIDLSPEEKEQVYTENQRPVLRLRKELKDAKRDVLALKRKRRKGTTPALVEAQQVVLDLEEKLFHAIQNCREDTYNRINSSGTMGMEQASGGDIQVDYHALRVRDAMRKFDELVLPLLPVLGQLLIITGRGKRSGTGTSVLQSALKDHIENFPDEAKRNHLHWEAVAGNDGVIRVIWQD